MTNLIELFAMYEAKAALEATREAKVAEPEFKRFRFERKELRPAAVVPANTALVPHTLEELGVPGGLARELERALRGGGHTRGDRVTGFTFRTVDGARYDLRTAAPAAGSTRRAA